MPPFSFLKNFKETRSERSNFVMPCSPEELGKEGFIDGTGKVTQPKYTAGDYRQCPEEEITEGLVSVPMPNYKQGVLDINTGKEIVPPKYDEIVSFQDGKAKACINKKCGFVDKTGTESGWETKSGTSSEIVEEANKATQDAAKANAKTDVMNRGRLPARLPHSHDLLLRQLEYCLNQNFQNLENYQNFYKTFYYIHVKIFNRGFYGSTI